MFFWDAQPLTCETLTLSIFQVSVNVSNDPNGLTLEGDVAISADHSTAGQLGS